METKRVKRFLYTGLGFPVVLLDVTLIRKMGVWTPAIPLNKFQKQVLLALCHKPLGLTGNEIHFIRVYFEMTLEKFGDRFGVTHAAVLNWEKAGNKSARINPTTELCIRLFILEKLKINNQVFRDTFREFDMRSLAKEQKAPAKIHKPIALPSSPIRKRRSFART